MIYDDLLPLKPPVQATSGFLFIQNSEKGTTLLIVHSLITKLTFSLPKQFVKFLFEINGLNSLPLVLDNFR